MAYESFININFWTALFSLCNMIITFLFLKKVLFKPVKKMIDDRNAEINGLYQDAGDQKEKAEALFAKYTERLKQASEEGDRIIHDATQQAHDREEVILRDAQSKATRAIERAQTQIELEKKQAMNNLKDQVSEIAVDIASAVLQKDIDGSVHTELIDSFITGLGDGND